MQIIRSIQNRIYEIRGERVLLDFDLAALYEVETKAFNQAVKRNIKRFPKDFMFQLTRQEWTNIKPEVNVAYIESIDNQNTTGNRSQFVTGSQRHRSTLPYAFTEQGVAMLSGILNSDRAIQMNIAIMRAFVEVRKILLQQNDIKEQIKELKERVGGHDVQLSHIYDALENLLDEKAAERKWENRERIGFKK
ncbi:DNA-binding protein [Niabella ginsenosidivorans]|uniref:DNA-binding protein n=1 Tax=Niabella ginsenosidivorans TaxID=1176587 RepID=A0A1A9HYM9_9BACT|nr:ORF6N domain-containing protein [Niabella ginsenosidivorans]ANH79919.1 DNA-binding protein [Niabella ginsenosidivorans]